MDSVADVDIDSKGVFKYILIEVKKQESKERKLIVRGYADCGYHADIYDRVYPDIESKGLKTDCLGGGRISHDPAKKTICVYGYSTGFGRADHAKSMEVLKKTYSDYNISWSNEGY